MNDTTTTRTVGAGIAQACHGHWILAHLLLSNGATVTAYGWELKDGALVGYVTKDDEESATVSVEPQSVVASFIPDDRKAPLPWQAR